MERRYALDTGSGNSSPAPSSVQPVRRELHNRVFLRSISTEFSARRGAATARSRAGGSAETMTIGSNGALLQPVEPVEIEVANVAPGGRLDGDLQHLVEVAVVEPPVPADREGIAAHDAARRRRIEGSHQPFHIMLEI